MVVAICNPSYLGGSSGRITCAQKGQGCSEPRLHHLHSSLADRERPCLKEKEKAISSFILMVFVYLHLLF